MLILPLAEFGAIKRIAQACSKKSSKRDAILPATIDFTLLQQQLVRIIIPSLKSLTQKIIMGKGIVFATSYPQEFFRLIEIFPKLVREYEFPTSRPSQFPFLFCSNEIFC